MLIMIAYRLVFHYTNQAGSLSPASTKDMHLSVVSREPSLLSSSHEVTNSCATLD